MVSILFADLGTIHSAATDLELTLSELNKANFLASERTTLMPTAASDEVSASAATFFNSHAVEYQLISKQLSTFHAQFSQTLSRSAGLYATAEAANSLPLQGFEQALLDLVNAPTRALLGRPLIGNGADATSPGGRGGDGGLLYGNGGNGARGGPGQTGGSGGNAGLFGDGGSGGFGGNGVAGGSGGNGGLLVGNGGIGGNGGPAAVGINGGQPGLGGAGGTGGLLHGHTGAAGQAGTGGSTGGAGLFNPYVDVTLYPSANGYDFQSAASAGVKNATLAFIVADPNGAAAWGGLPAYSITGGSDIGFINNQIANMKSAGITGTLSFGGANGTDLAVYAAANGMTAAQLAQQYQSVMTTYDIYNIDFDVEGGMQTNSAAVTLQAQAITLAQEWGTTNGKNVRVSYTLPVMPTGLTADGLSVLQTAKTGGVNTSLVNIMAMDYGPSGIDMGDAAISAATATHSQLMTLYPTLSSQQAWQMLGVTPMIGLNDIQGETFTLSDAQDVTNFAIQNNVGQLAMWSLSRDVTGQLGVVAPNGSGIAQTPFEFSQIFGQFVTGLN